MAQRCDVCGKGPSVGHSVSHAHKLTKRRWLPNLVSMRALVAGKAQRVRVCTRCLKAGKVTKNRKCNYKIRSKKFIIVTEYYKLKASHPAKRGNSHAWRSYENCTLSTKTSTRTHRAVQRMDKGTAGACH